MGQAVLMLAPNGTQVCLVANLKHKNMKWFKRLFKKKQVEIVESK